MRIQAFALGPLGTNCYLVENDGRAVCIDPGGDPAQVTAAIEKGGLALEAILNTHLHFDHTAGNAALSRATGAPILASDLDRPLLGNEIGSGGFMGLPVIEPFEFTNLAPGETELAGLGCTVLATPGHSDGSLTLYFPDLEAAFVGDLVFQRSIGRTDFPGGDLDTLVASVREKVFTLPEDTALLSGHGPATSVADERNHNPFLAGHAY